MSLFGAPGGGSLVPAGGASQVKGSIAEKMKSLSALIFSPKLSIERFGEDFKTPTQVLSCIQSLLVVILQTEPPANDDGSAGPYNVYWDRFSAHVECKRSEGGNLVDRLFDCLDAVAPCTTGCACSSNASSSPLPPTLALVGSWERGAVLDVASMACCCPSPSSEGDKNKEKTSSSSSSSGGGGGGSGVGGRAPNGRIALVEALQLQLAILSCIAGSLRAISKAIKGYAAAGRSLKVEGWHSEAGMLHSVASRLLAQRGFHSGAGPGGGSSRPLLDRLHDFGSLGRMDALSQPGFSQEETLLVECLAAQVRDAASLVVISSLGHGLSPASQWGGGCELPPGALQTLLAAAFMQRIAGGASAGGGGDAAAEALLEVAAAGGGAAGGGGGRDTGGLLGGKAAASMSNAMLGDATSAELVFNGMAAVGELAQGTWLLSRTCSDDSMPWASEWEQVLHCQARQGMFECIGIMCLSLQHMQQHCPASFERFEGAMLRGADDAVGAVMAGWDEYLLSLGACRQLLMDSGMPFDMDSFQGGLRWLIMTGRMHRERQGPAGRMLAVFFMDEALAHMYDGAEVELGTDYARMLLNAAADLCQRLPQLDADMRSFNAVPGREDPGPNAEVLESLSVITFSFRYMEQGADIEALEAAVSSLVSSSLSSSLCLIAVLSITRYLAPSLQVQSEEQWRRLQAARSKWQAVAAAALECIGQYSWHAVLTGSHNLAVDIVSLCISHLDSAAVASQLLLPDSPLASVPGGGLSSLCARVVEREEEEAVPKMPISRGLMSLTETLLDAFEKHFGSGATPSSSAGGDTQAASTDPHRTNAAMALASIEEVCRDTSVAQRYEWKSLSTPSGLVVWGWSRANMNKASHTSSVAFHILTPLVHFAIHHILPLSSRFRSLWSSHDAIQEAAAAAAGAGSQSGHGGQNGSSIGGGGAGAMMGVGGDALFQNLLHAERSRAPLQLFNSAIRLCDRLLADEALLLSLLRTETFLLKTAPSALQSAHIGCAGLQDRPDVFLFLFHSLERESGPAVHMIKFMEMRNAQGGSLHRGMDRAMQGILSVLRRMLLLRCDRHTACADSSLERAALQLAPTAVACMCSPPKSLALPSLLLSDDDEREGALSREASRFLSIICRLDMRPLTIRQSWAQWRRDVAQVQRRSLLEIATDCEASVDLRVSVLAFLSEALLSQPGLADWLFKDDSDPNSTAVGKADASGASSMTLDPTSSKTDGYYKGWVLEVRGGKGQGQLPRVVKSYNGSTREATLSAPWDASLEQPDSTSQYTLCRQLQLRRVVKAFLHPDFAYTGGWVGSEKESNRLKVMQHTMILMHTIWDSVPEERASVVQGFCDSDCLIFGLESPDDAEVINTTSRWRTFSVRMHTQGGKRTSAGVFAAPDDALIQQGRKGEESSSGKKLCLMPPSDEAKALGWLKPKDGGGGGGLGQGGKGAGGGPDFWQAMCRWVMGAPSESQDGGGKFTVERDGTMTVRCKMPASLYRQPLPLLDGSRSNSALIRVVGSQDTLARILRVRCHVRGRYAREVWDAIEDISNDRDACVERLRAELRLADWCMQEMEKQGYEVSECVDAAICQMWDRLPHRMLFTDMDGEREKALRPVPLPYMLRNYIYASVVSSRAGGKGGSKGGGNDDEEIIRMFESPAGPLAYGIDTMCRRTHIEACAVSIAAIHLEQDPLPLAQGASSAEKAEAAQREEMVSKLAGRALRSLCCMRWPDVGGSPDDHVLLEGEQSWKDGPRLEVLKFVEKIAFVVPPGQDTLSHAQQVYAKLACLADFSGEWHLDSRRACSMAGPIMQDIAQALNRDRAVDDVSNVLAIAYCRFLDAAAVACPSLLLKGLNEGNSGDSPVPSSTSLVVGGGNKERTGTSPLNTLLTSLVRVLPIVALSRDLEIAARIAKTVSVLVHMAWPLHPKRHQELFPALPAPVLLSSIADALTAVVQSEKRQPRVGQEQAAQSMSFCEGSLDCLLRLLLYLLDLRAALDSHGLKQGAEGGASNPNPGLEADWHEAADLLGSIDKDPALFVRLSGALGTFARGQANGGPVARKCCSIISLLVRICPWTEGHWESILDQSFWTVSPGVLRWIGGDMEGRGGIDAMGVKDAGLDAMSALELIVAVAKTEQGAALLANNNIMAFLRQGPLHARVSRPDAQQLRFYVPTGTWRQHNRWHQVWCQALQAVNVLTVKLAKNDTHMSELVSFAVTYTERMARVLTIACHLQKESSGRDAQDAQRGGAGAGGFVAGMRSLGLSAQELADAELGRVPSLAVLEEARLWSALLLRLSNRFTVWAPHVPALASIVLQLIPEVVASLTYVLSLWSSDTAAFERRLAPVSERERLEARTVSEGQGRQGQVPCGEAKSVLDKPIQEAIHRMELPDRSRLKLERQRCVYNQRLLDTLLSLLHNCLRIMVACGDQVQPFIERSISRWTPAGTTSSLAEWQHSNPTNTRRVACSLGTIIAAADAAISYLSYVVHVEWACEGATAAGEAAGKVRGGAWQDEVEALQHRRGMLLRLIECAGLLIGRFAGDLHVSDACRELLTRLKTSCTTPPASQVVDGKGSGRCQLRQRDEDLNRTLSTLRSAMRNIFETL